MQHKIIYFTDALCGWCFGFSPVVAQLQATYQDRIAFDVISGGLFLDERAGLINDVAPHIKAGAYKQVEARTGVKFGERFLTEGVAKGAMTLNSRPPAAAICIVKEHKPEQAIPFVSTLLNAFYVDGMDSEDSDGYAALAAEIGLDAGQFSAEMQTPHYHQQAQAEFDFYRGYGVRGFPSLVLESGGQRYLLATGYAPFAQLAEQLDAFLAANATHSG